MLEPETRHGPTSQNGPRTTGWRRVAFEDPAPHPLQLLTPSTGQALVSDPTNNRTTQHPIFKGFPREVCLKHQNVRLEILRLLVEQR